MAAYEMFYIVGVTNVDIMSYVSDFKLERELEKLLDKLTFKVSRRIDTLAGFVGFNPNVEILLQFNSIGIFRGRIKTSDKKQVYSLEAYSCAEILDRTLAQKVYENTTPEAIFDDLISTYSDLTPISVVSDIVIDRLVADDYVGTIISNLANAMDWLIYTDSAKNIYFKPRGNTTNASIIRRQSASSNAIFGEWKKDYNELCNEIKVTGDNINYDTQETFTGDGSTKDFTLSEQPVSVKVSLDGVESSKDDYDVDAEFKKITFVTAPASLVSIVIDYSYALPLYAVRDDTTSISTNGKFTKIFFHKWLKTRADIITYCKNYIEGYKDALLSNVIQMNSAYITIFTPGEQVRIIDDLESYDDYYVINRIKLELLKGMVEIHVGSYIPIFSNTQNDIIDRIKELEKNLSKASLRLYINKDETLFNDDGFDESAITDINFKLTTYQARCDYGRGTLYDARVGLCQS